jgi:PAS domain S-box-containing protein
MPESRRPAKGFSRMKEKRVHPGFPLFTAIVFAGLTAAISLGAWLYYRHQVNRFKEGVKDELLAVANLKAEQLVSWRKQRLADANLVASSHVLDFVRNGPRFPKYADDGLSRIRDMLSVLRDNFGYSAVFVTDVGGRLITGTEAPEGEPLYVDTASIRRAVREKKPLVVDFYRCSACDCIHMDIVAPLGLTAADSRHPPVVLVFRSDPEKFLYPLIQRWPTPAKTAETLILRREGDSVVFLNELRHRKGTALLLKAPLSSPLLPAARVARGEEGFMEGADYRGARVFAVAKHLPETPWYLVSKIDKDEVLAPLAATGRLVFLIALLLAAVSLMLIVAWWREYDRKMRSAQIREAEERRRAESALSLSEGRYRSLFENMLNGFEYCEMVYGPDGRPTDFRFIEVNRSFEKITGLSGVAGKLASEMIPGIHTSDPQMVEIYDKVASTGNPEHFESFVRALKIWFSVSAYSPEKGRFVAVFENITQRKTSEASLRASEARFHGVLDAMMEGCQILGHDWRYLYINDAAERHNRRPKSELLGRRYMDMWPGIEETEVFKAIRNCMERHAAVTMENEFVFPSGAARWFDLRIQPVPEGVFILSVDITERKLAERHKALAAEVLSILNENMSISRSAERILAVIKKETGLDGVGIRMRRGDDFPYAVTEGFSKDFLLAENSLIARNEKGDFCLDENGRIRLECTCGLVVTGRTDPANPLFTAFGSAWTNNTLPFLDVPPEQDQRFNPRNRCIHDGYRSVALIPIKANKEIVGVLHLIDRRPDRFTPEAIGYFEKISASFGIALSRKQDEEKIVALNGDLVQKNAELEQLVYVTSHDLRSPLVNVQGFSRELGISLADLNAILKKQELSGDERTKAARILEHDIPEAQEYILASVAKMDGLLAGLLKLSRLGRAALTIEQLDMNELIGSALKTFEYRIKESGIEATAGNLPPCRGDRVQVNQIFSNLLDNAIKFMNPGGGGKISVTGTASDDRSEYCVEDNGIGIAPEHHEKIFDIFYRLTPSATQGDGLGLTIVRRSLGRLNGTVRVESEAGKGSRFYVSLPS